MNAALQPFLGGEVSHVEKFVQDAVVLDIGAHHGAFTLWAVEHGARFVYAFEPLPVNCAEFSVNTGDIENCRVICAAIGKEDGRCDLRVPYGEPSGTFTVPGDDCLVIGWQTLLDGYRAADLTIDLLKLDIEGGEYDLFPDADLSSIRHFVIELHDWTPEDELPCEGVGKRPGPSRREGAYEELLDHLLLTHQLDIYGSSTGGFVIGERR